MKWGTFISFIFLVSFTESKTLPRRYRHVDEKHNFGDLITELHEENFKAIATAMFAQFVQESTYEEVTKMVKDVTAFAHKCVASKEDPECGKAPLYIILSEVCHEQGLPEKYGLADCCAKADAERNECFLSHKNSTPGFIPPFKKPDPEEGCKQYQEHRDELLGLYIYELARRYPFLYASTILLAAGHYEEMLKACCQAEDKAACFHEKAPSVMQPVRRSGLVEDLTCEILKKFGERTLKALKLVQISQKFPKADFATVNKLVTDVVHIHTDCCHGDMLDCMHDRIEMTNYACSHQDAISSKLKGCCEKSLIEKGECIVHLENDDKPADLSPTVREFIEDKDVCDHLAKEQDVFLAKFVYEYSRRHPEFSAQMLLRAGKGYQELLENCCKTSNPPECYGKGEELLKKHIQESQELITANCNLFKEQGEYYFHNTLLVRYTKKMPQLSSEELRRFTKQMEEFGAKCCQLSEDKIFPCAEEYIDLVMGQICRRHYASPINPNVCKCCSDSYALRRPCISGLGLDEKYVPIPLTPGLFSFHEDLCATEEKELQRKKQELLISLIKHKPTITDEQLKTIITSFITMREKCCKAENHEACFGEEGPKLIAESQVIFAL
ncbi:alpha-fetoprotein-like [Emydura macquarii macquarii]|uniref:alpha-fetoprotein-like n=1 Tax=Emydura macquarii macquarii TaxID=1129001 RepID=UPI00352B8EB6